MDSRPGHRYNRSHIADDMVDAVSQCIQVSRENAHGEGGA